MTEVFEALKAVMERFEDRLAVQHNKPGEYTLVTRKPSPFPQHKGQPMFFGSVRLGKAYVSYHLMPIYMCDPLQALISPGLKKRMQGKACFNFKSVPDEEILVELSGLTEAGLRIWNGREWT